MIDAVPVNPRQLATVPNSVAALYASLLSLVREQRRLGRPSARGGPMTASSAGGAV
jgi:hypothetical protein